MFDSVRYRMYAAVDDAVIPSGLLARIILEKRDATSPIISTCLNRSICDSSRMRPAVLTQPNLSGRRRSGCWCAVTRRHGQACHA